VAGENHYFWLGADCHGTPLSTSDPERVLKVIEKHGEDVTLDLFLDLARVLGLRLAAKVIDE
jgi:hypothetical protein